MGKKAEKILLSHDFGFLKDEELNAQIAAFAAAHERQHHQILAMDGKRPLGPGKVRVSFRVLPKKPVRS
jgi:hypothetical protein